jgi:hypothetical protein
MSVINISDYRVNKLQEGPPPLTAKKDPTSFWTFIAAWRGNWMWRDIVNSNKSKDNMQWVAEGMTAGTLIWTTDRSYNRKKPWTYRDQAGLYSARPRDSKSQDCFGNDPPQPACFEQRCLVCAHFIY